MSSTLQGVHKHIADKIQQRSKNERYFSNFSVKFGPRTMRRLKIEGKALRELINPTLSKVEIIGTPRVTRTLGVVTGIEIDAYTDPDI